MKKHYNTIGSVKRGGRFTKNHFAVISKVAPQRKIEAERSTQVQKLKLMELEADSEIELLEFDSSSNQQYNSFEDEIFADLMKGVKHNKISIEKRAKTYGVGDKNNAKELTELAIVNVAREIIKTNQYPYEKLVDLYYNQPNLSHRTSNSIILNQYSTPAPIAYLAGLYIRNWYVHEQYFEPTAGNGLLTIALPKSKVIVNELDKFRYSNLKKQQYSADFNIDAISLCKQFQSDKSGLFKFTGIIANPPFETLEKALEVDGFVIRKLEHLIAIYALKTMLDNGKASIIVGGHTEYESERRGFDKQYFVKKGADRYFLNYLYHHYNVEDIINIDGHALYSRQGTSINTRLILINGRKKAPEGFATKTHPELSDVVTDFYELEKRVIRHIKTNQN